MFEELQTREEWSAGICSLVTEELHRGANRGLLTRAEAHQLASRFLILIDQALDLPSIRLSGPFGGQPDWVAP